MAPKKRFLTEKDLYIEQPTQEQDGKLHPETEEMVDRIERILLRPTCAPTATAAPKNLQAASAQMADWRKNHAAYKKANIEYLKTTLTENPALLLAPGQEIFVELSFAAFGDHPDADMRSVMKTLLKDPQVLETVRQIDDIAFDLSAYGHYDPLKVLMKDKDFVKGAFSSVDTSIVGNALLHHGSKVANGRAKEGDQESVMDILGIVLKDKELRTQLNPDDETVLYECARYGNVQAFAEAIKYDDLRLYKNDDGKNIAVEVAWLLNGARQMNTDPEKKAMQIAALEGCLKECAKYEDLVSQPTSTYSFEEQKPFAEVVVEKKYLTQKELAALMQPVAAHEATEALPV